MITSTSLAWRLLGAAFVTVVTLTTAACGNAVTAAPVASSPAPSPPAPDARAAPAERLERIERAIGTAPCTSAQQCRTLPVGHRPCGGPERFLAYSSSHSDESALRSLGVELAAQQQKADTAAGRMSTCSVVVDPGATCNAGHCVLNARGLGDALAR